MIIAKDGIQALEAMECSCIDLIICDIMMPNDVRIKRLRERLIDFAEFEIVTIRGLGYKKERRNSCTCI